LVPPDSTPVSLGVEERLQVIHAVQALPGEVRIVAAEVAVGGSLGVDGTLQVEGVDDGPGRRSKISAMAALMRAGSTVSVPKVST
jgi:hypothetical protein